MSGVAESPNGGGRAWIGYAVATGCLVWVFQDIRWRELLARVGGMTWWLLAPAIGADIGSYVAQGARWSLLLRPMGRLPIPRATQAIYAALFTNEVLPLRAGEVLRGYLVNRWTSLSLTRIFSSIFVERFLDGVWMVLAFGVVVLTVPLPRFLVDAEEVLAVATFSGAAVFVYLVARRRHRMEDSVEGGVTRDTGGGMRRLIERVAMALGAIGGSPSFYGAVALSGLMLVLQAVSFWLVMEAYGLRLSVWQGGAVLLIVRLGTMVPGAPANVGTYQFFAVLGLMLFQVDKTVATGFSVVVFLILTIPLWVIGLVAFGKAGLSLRTVREEMAGLRKRWQEPPAARGGAPVGE